MILPALPFSPSMSSKLVMYSAMATWCASCRSELPELAQLRSQETLGQSRAQITEDAALRRQRKLTRVVTERRGL